MELTSIQDRSQVDLEPVMLMSRAVAAPGSLAETLSIVSAAAADLLDSYAAVILLRDGHNRLRFAGGYGLSPGYAKYFAADQENMPVIEALRLERPVVIADTEAEERFAPWRHIARAEGFRALMALPMTLGANTIGTLAVYRRTEGTWSTQELDFLRLASGHVASAVRTAELIDEQKRQLEAHSRVVRGLREQRQTHVERLTSLRTSLDDDEGLRQLLKEFEAELTEAYSAVASRIQSRVVASMLLGEASIARRKGVHFRLDRRSRLLRLPERLGEVETVSIVSNLLENAFDAVADLPTRRRRASLFIRSDADRAVFRVRDWGVGIADLDDESLLQHGFTTKNGHSGVGLAIVADLVEAAGGALEIERPEVGAAFKVVIPSE
jgi:signal transduction histidine kinase